MAAQESLEELYSRLSLEEDGEGGIIVTGGAPEQKKETYVLVGRFLTEKNINFSAMQNVLASLWRPREGMEIHDIGGHRYSFVFFHVLDLKKVIEGGPWTFEQNLLIYHKLGEKEDPHLVPLNQTDMWVQIYDLPQGLFMESVFMNIGNFVGTFVSSDPTNSNGQWKLYARTRVTMDITKPLKRRMRIKRDGGDWSWISFKYERLSTFCFVCGMLGHLERDCGIVYAHPDKEITRAYGVWLRAPTRNMKNQNLGAKWLRNGPVERKTWEANSMNANQSTTVQGRDKAEERFMEVDGRITEIPGDNGGIRVVQREDRDMSGQDTVVNQLEKITGENKFENEQVVVDSKRRRMDMSHITDENEESLPDGPMQLDGSKNLPKAGPVLQARLEI